MTILSIYLLLINIVAIMVYGIDKLQAIHDHWRVPESVLITLAAVGGSVGALAAMICFHHKVRKVKFFIGVPLILAAQIVIMLFITKVF